jgi:hypothetical protein
VADQDTGDGGAKPPEAPTPEGARPEGQQQGTGTGREAPAGDDDADSLRERGRVALDRERTARREAEQRATDLEQRLTAIEDQGKSELERAIARLDRQASDLDGVRARNTELEQELARRDLLDLKRDVALELGIPLEAAHRLQGTDARSIKADAQRYLDERRRLQGDLGVGRGGAAAQRGSSDMNDLIRQASGR